MAKRVPPLAAAAVAKIKPDPLRTVEFVDGDVPGLRLRVTPKGTRTWSLNIRASGVMRRFDVGVGLGLSEARAKAKVVRQRVADGADPTAEKREIRARAVSAKLGIGTFGAAVDAYFSVGNGTGLKTKAEQRQRIRSVFKDHLNRPSMEVSSSELQRAVDAHAAKVAAARAVGYINPVVKWAAKRGLVQGAFDLEKPLQGAPEQKVIDCVELAALWPTLTDPYGRCCRLMLLTGARREEACNATWGQFAIDKGVWTIPAEVRKDTRAQTKRRVKPKPAMQVPLSRQAIALLEEVKAAEISRRQLEGVSSEIAPDDRVFVGQKGGRLDNWDRWLKKNTKKSGVSRWSAHALRRTTATLAGDLGAPPHVVSVILGHANLGGQLVAGYNKSRYETEHAKVLQDVADRIDELNRSHIPVSGAA
ncbi:MAG: tyrosine-type recombinase/integrase [Sphingomonadaceae bacterium]|jgi:integrase